MPLDPFFTSAHKKRKKRQPAVKAQRAGEQHWPMILDELGHLGTATTDELAHLLAIPRTEIENCIALLCEAEQVISPGYRKGTWGEEIAPMWVVKISD